MMNFKKLNFLASLLVIALVAITSYWAGYSKGQSTAQEEAKSALQNAVAQIKNFQAVWQDIRKIVTATTPHKLALVADPGDKTSVVELDMSHRNDYSQFLVTHGGESLEKHLPAGSFYVGKEPDR